ncbi:MAG: diacylglycerol/lipid kinase family protein [Solirubrobacteraceae bacterium]
MLVNPAAGGGRGAKAMPAVEAELRRRGVSFHTELTAGLDHARDLARTARDRAESVLTLGGDGLAGAVAAVLRDGDCALGVLPGGRGNDFCRVLGVPLEPVAACAVLAEGRVRAVDLGEIDGRVFIGIASCGFDSEANRIANEAPAGLGSLVYAYGALRALASWKPARFTLELDGERHSYTGYTVAAANSKAYGGGMFMAPNAELDDGLLDVVVTEHVAKARFLRELPKVFKGTHVESPAVHVHRAREVRIAASRPFEVYADGDPIAALPAVARALPGALPVIAPAQ